MVRKPLQGLFLSQVNEGLPFFHILSHSGGFFTIPFHPSTKIPFFTISSDSLPFLTIPSHPFLLSQKEEFYIPYNSVLFLTIQSQEKYHSFLFLAMPFQSFPFLPIPYPFLSIKKNMLVLGGIWILDLPPSTICLKVFPCICYILVFLLNKIFIYNNSV